ncbi:MAG: MnhB domain-containing protein [Acidobacteriota bacterium]|nr:MnhB domain-containing protein [Acidobacteriota bacterium]
MKKPSLLLEMAARRQTPVLLIVSLWVLFRGHNHPGGGFIGGLLAAGGLGFYSLTYGPKATRRYMRIDPIRLIGIGCLTALGAGLMGWLGGLPFLTGIWTDLPLIGKVGTPLLFDIGVYLTVIGAAVSMLHAFEEA